MVACALAVPAAAHAATLKGQVAGQPYLAGGDRTAVPVLLSRETAGRAKLASPMGLAVVSRRTPLRAPGGQTVLPGRLRPGDKFTATGTVPRAMRKAAYPRLTFKRMTVTKRAKQLSTAELEELLAQTRRELGSLSATVSNLSGATQRALADLGARVRSLRSDVDGLTAGLAAAQADLTALSGQLIAAAADLRGRIDLVRADLQPQVTSALNQITALGATIGSCGVPSSVVGRLCTLEAAFGALDPTAVAALTDRVTQVSSALTSTVASLTGLTLVGDLPATLTAPVLTAIGQLTGLQGTVAGLSGTVATVSGDVAGLQGSVGTLLTQVGAVDVTGMSATLTNLLGTLGSDPAGLTSSVVGGLQTTLAGVQSDVSGVLTNLGAVNVQALNTTVSGITGNVATIQTTLTGVCSAVNGQSIPVLGSLPLIGAVTGLLTATLTDACP